MDLIGLLKDLSSIGAVNLAVWVVFLVMFRRWLNELRDGIAQDLERNLRLCSSDPEQSHKDIMLHLIDVRERLANIEGRLGAPTPRMSAVSPPLEAPAEEPSAQS